MARGPHITQEEIDKAHALKKEGLSAEKIKEALKRSLGAIYKMLSKPETPIAS